ARWIHRHVVNAVSDLGPRIRDVLRVQTLVNRLPCRAAIVGAKGARSRNGDEHTERIARVEDDGVQTHSTRARLPFGPGTVSAQTGKLAPVLSPVARAEQRRIFHTCVNCIRIGERRLQMPDALKLPWMLRPIVK